MRRSLPLAVLLALHAWGGGAGRAAQVADEEPAKVHVPDSAFDFLRPLRRASGGPLPGARASSSRAARAATRRRRYRRRPGRACATSWSSAASTGRKASDLKLVTLVPFASKQQGRIGRYQIGSWPAGTAKPRSRAYARAGRSRVRPPPRRGPDASPRQAPRAERD
jgi:hypothetical protein